MPITKIRSNRNNIVNIGKSEEHELPGLELEQHHIAFLKASLTLKLGEDFERFSITREFMSEPSIEIHNLDAYMFIEELASLCNMDIGAEELHLLNAIYSATKKELYESTRFSFPDVVSPTLEVSV